MNIISLRINNRKHKSVISKFADKVGLVYFGYVNQHSDDHKVVRGFTVSSSHHDGHYCVGSVGGYSVSVVDRSDNVSQPDGSTKLHNWLIMAFDLHTKKPIPHFFIGAKGNDSHACDALFSTFPNMKEVDLGTFEAYSPEFKTRYSIFARPAKSVEVEGIIDAKASMVIGAHLWPLLVEQHENVLYIYANDQRITSTLLDTMLENGLWLAGHIDQFSSYEV